MSNRCMRRGCDIIASITCIKCNIVKYCSEECMRVDLPGHSIICRESYHDMLRAYYQHLSERSHGYFTLSYKSGVHVKYDGMENYHHIGFSKDFFCICCGKPGMMSCGNEIHLTNKIYYRRCIYCNEKDIRICTNSFIDDKLCWRGLKSLMILREYMMSSDIPYEIFGYIAGIASEISCKQHMFS